MMHPVNARSPVADTAAVTADETGPQREIDQLAPEVVQIRALPAALDALSTNAQVRHLLDAAEHAAGDDGRVARAHQAHLLPGRRCALTSIASIAPVEVGQLACRSRRRCRPPRAGGCWPSRGSRAASRAPCRPSRSSARPAARRRGPTSMRCTLACSVVNKLVEQLVEDRALGLEVQVEGAAGDPGRRR